ncbi:hypothetical protein CLF_110358 [Clonorchis sinensis]|uniref:Uncharacterized protein n=1 Tax=Clonorchis sinensis TaxID=79923 RepID=G7YKK9_CLOSI|nr:hypothetical protein CLF_110358 [Clonorchis sinensis]
MLNVNHAMLEIVVATNVVKTCSHLHKSTQVHKKTDAVVQLYAQPIFAVGQVTFTDIAGEIKAEYRLQNYVQVCACKGQFADDYQTRNYRPHLDTDLQKSAFLDNNLTNIANIVNNFRIRLPSDAATAQKSNRKAAVLGWKRKYITNFTEHVATHVPTPNIEGQEIMFIRPLPIDQPGMRDSLGVAQTPSSIAQWVAEVHKPPHHGTSVSFALISVIFDGMTSLCNSDASMSYNHKFLLSHARPTVINHHCPAERQKFRVNIMWQHSDDV